MDIYEIKRAADVLNEAAQLLTPEVIQAILIFDSNDIYAQIDTIVEQAQSIIKFQRFNGNKQSELKFVSELFDNNFVVDKEDFTEYLSDVTTDFKKLLPYAKLRFAYKKLKPAMKMASSYLE